MAFLGLLALTAGNPVHKKIGLLDLGMDGRIVGGEATTIEQSPYQVSLQVAGEHFCGGAIIAKNWVVTAGHCVHYEANEYQIRTGATDVRKGSLHRVEKVLRHEDYDYTEWGLPINDVALLKIVDSDAFHFTNQRKPVKLNEGNSTRLVGKNALVTGWGTTDTGTPMILQKVLVPLLKKSVCDYSYREYGGIPFGEICAGYDAGGKDACQGDSGGPLLVDGRLSGIVSWGNDCGDPNYPGVYTDVAYYRQWIKTNSGV